jgi:hypothetical protein
MRKLAPVLVVLALGVGGCHRNEGSRGEAVAQKDAEQVLESTAWMDRAPMEESDVIHAWIFQGEGLYFTGNAYKASFERFRYYAEDGKLKLRWLDDGAKHEIGFRIERVRDPVFDYKLTLDGDPRGPSVYYGFDNSRRQLPAGVKALLDHMPR